MTTDTNDGSVKEGQMNNQRKVKVGYLEVELFRSMNTLGARVVYKDRPRLPRCFLNYFTNVLVYFINSTIRIFSKFSGSFSFDMVLKFPLESGRTSREEVTY